MKKLILLLALAFVMCGCGTPYKPYSIVTKVEKATVQWYVTEYKYIIKTDNDFCFYTDILLQVGDTIQITKKN